MKFLYREHIKSVVKAPLEGKSLSDIVFLNSTEAKCARFYQESGLFHVECSYYVGADWFPHLENEWFYVESKLNTRFDPTTGVEIKHIDESKDLVEVDVLNMLFQALQEPEVRDHTQELFEIKFDSPWIPLNRKQDLISPLIMIQFMNLVKDIVRKGLKKSYYKVEKNLYAKVKGKVLVGQTIKHNLVKNKNLNTYCQYEEFGVNGIENRILKKALVYIRRYMTTFKGLSQEPFFQETFNYIQPAFQDVSEEVGLNDIKHLKFNPFYKNYEKAIELAKLILQRFSYNLNTIQDQDTILTPPFWIDMSKLFELYVLGKLRNRFPIKSQMLYQFGDRANSLDFILNSDGYQMVIDAKYKSKYSHHFVTEDIRQVSGYARLKKVHNHFGFDEGTLIDCLIIYPDMENGFEKIPDNLHQFPVNDYFGTYKLGIWIPTMMT
ncbi:McrC family protein [Cognataquiflexum rubidum]|uniref:McrC family protein n=1 Tax=Cognataquiflexum rubidum TaxID=2922273 RepID=UPI001F12EBBD|nr:McrC family protein [Cognataquiflexum rubidum]MCH6236669.1 McrC family protein [Cognataquiflexum rubidum]